MLRSPSKVKGASQHKNPERPVATVREIAIATEAMDEQYRLAVPLACYCQLRRSEVLCIQRKHIDLRHSTLRVEQAWTLSGGEMHLGPPKTQAGRRDVPIPANVVSLLEDHLERFAGIGDGGWLFPGHGDSVISARTLDRQWALAREVIGRPDLHFHDLRHTGLTLVAITGATTAEIMAAGGHESQAAAIRYQHATRERRTAIADALAAMADGRIEPLSPTKGHAGARHEQRTHPAKRRRNSRAECRTTRTRCTMEDDIGKEDVSLLVSALALRKAQPRARLKT